jgi:peptidoglycan/LPS O-acetylase OafA/YrhL
VQQQAGRIAGLDVLRGLAAVAVMLHHHGEYYDALYRGRTPLFVNLHAGHFGVELFFIISGFVILMTIERKGTVRDFAVSRFTRLMPAFVAALVIASVILSLWPMPPLQAPTARQFLANLTMAAELLGESYVDLPYWTLTYELIFYVLMAVVLAFGRLRSLEWLGLLAIAVGLAFLALSDPKLHRRTSIVLLVGYSNFFLIGICLYRIHMHQARPITWIALLVAIAVTALGGGERAFYASGVLYLTLTVIFAAMVWFMTSPRGARFAWSPLVFLGGISYPLYLVHVGLGFPLIRWLTAGGWSTLASTAAAGVASIAVATVLHYAVEEPAARWLRTRVERRLTRPVPLPHRALPTNAQPGD